MKVTIEINQTQAEQVVAALAHLRDYHEGRAGEFEWRDVSLANAFANRATMAEGTKNIVEDAIAKAQQLADLDR